MPFIVRSLLALILVLVAAAAGASEASVKQAVQQKYPNVQIESVARTPMPGIYEIYADGEILYVDEKANHLIVGGRMIDAGRKMDLTSERLRALSAVKLDQLPLELSFRKVQGNGSRKIAYFTDPNCPYCKQIESSLNKLENVTIYIFLYPVLGPDSVEKSKAVWCSKDRARAWDDLMLNGNPPKTAGNCDTPIDKILAFGRRKGITGTPTLFLADGERVRGAVPLEQLKKLVDGAR
ncbi:MAG: DsbC family protein [Betaproteobacteria bacterium]